MKKIVYRLINLFIWKNIYDGSKLASSSVFQVTMVRKDDALHAIGDPNPCIDGRKANVNLAVLGAKPRMIAGGKLNTISLQFSMRLSCKITAFRRS